MGERVVSDPFCLNPRRLWTCLNPCMALSKMCRILTHLASTRPSHSSKISRRIGSLRISGRCPTRPQVVEPVRYSASGLPIGSRLIGRLPRSGEGPHGDDRRDTQAGRVRRLTRLRLQRSGVHPDGGSSLQAPGSESRLRCGSPARGMPKTHRAVYQASTFSRRRALFKNARTSTAAMHRIRRKLLDRRPSSGLGSRR